MKSLSSSLAITGLIYFASTVVLAFAQAPLGSPVFFACVAAASLAYLLMLRRIWNETRAPRRLLAAAFVLAVAFRAPIAAAPVSADSDMVRYLWDGRVQTLGYNPYLVVPADPAMAAVHTDETRRMPSLRTPTPYPPGAQLFFRLVVSFHDSTRAMKLALVACDLMTMIVLWRWLACTGRSEWLALAYAWNPLVVLEVAHSGHIDALGALWITASAYWLARRRTALASIAFVLAVATKLLPIVLIPLYWKRVRLRDGLAGIALLALLYLTFTRGETLPFGSVPNVVAYIRFNGPLFRTIAWLLGSPQAAALVVVALGMLLAAWARWRLEPGSPEAWAWPMAIALACAPVVYPWYLLYLTPFLFTVATWPLTAWTLSVMATYAVWHISRNGGRWIVPTAVLVIEYAVPLAVAALMLRRRVSTQHSAQQRNAVEPGTTLIDGTLDKPVGTLPNPAEPGRTP
jgi:alpha-1,6-mannosyltransferase